VIQRAGALFCASPAAHAQTGAPSGDGGPVPATERSWLFLPNLSYTPETGVGGGIVVGMYSRRETDKLTSSALLDLTFTIRRQVSVELQPELYMLHERLRIEGRVKAMIYPDVFYGIGAETATDDEEDFISRAVDLRMHVQRRMGSHLWLGVRMILYADEITETEQDGTLSTGVITGSKGGVSAGLGAIATLDSRDNRFNPMRGYFVEAHSTWFDVDVAGDFSFGVTSVDLRSYAPLTGRSAMALRGFMQLATGDPPFQLMPRLGGPRLLRGYRDGRIRDDVAAAVEAEYRFPIFSRIGGVAFAGAGGVDEDGPPSLSQLRTAFGLGARYRITADGVRVRADFSYGRDGGALYVGVGEAF
jgi:hypothetical protein